MKFQYTNHKGEHAERDIDVLALDYIRNPAHGYEPGWFLTGRDRDRNGDVRSFRLDERMLPVEAEMQAKIGTGISVVNYPITEGHEVRSAVDQLQDRVTEAIEQKRGELSGIGAYTEGATVDR